MSTLGVEYFEKIDLSITIGQMEILKYEQLDPLIQQNLEDAANAAKLHSFPPNGDVKVGAVLVSGDRTFEGVNIRRRSFNSSTCSERMALDKALFDGVKRIDRLVVTGLNDSQPFEEVISPCGACRQILFEAINILGQDDLQLIMSNTQKTKIVSATLKELLPLIYENAKRE